MYLLGWYFLVSATLVGCLYATATAFFPEKKRWVIDRFSSDKSFPMWLAETENPYSLLNSKAACAVLAPVLLMAFLLEIWWTF